MFSTTPQGDVASESRSGTSLLFRFCRFTVRFRHSLFAFIVLLLLTTAIVPMLICKLPVTEDPFALTTDEIQSTGRLLHSCQPSFQSGQLGLHCWTGGRHSSASVDPSLICPAVVPSSCLSSPLIPLLLSTFIPTDFERSTLIQLPVEYSQSLPLFHAIEALASHTDVNPGWHIEGVELHAFNQLVTRLVNVDFRWLGLAGAILLAALGLWTRSWLVCLLTVLSIGWSLLLAYSLYTRGLGIDSFPLLNCLALILVIGIGADDLLVVYHEFWTQSKIDHWPGQSSDNQPTDLTSLTIIDPPLVVPTPPSSFNLNDQLTRCLHDTISHTLPSIMLTSISTMTGILVNLLSPIVAIKRFALFASLVVGCNLLFVLACVPLTLLVFHGSTSSRCSIRCTKLSTQLSHLFNRFLVAPFIRLLSKCRYLLAASMIVMTILASYYLFARQAFCISPHPVSLGIFLPSSHRFQLFHTPLIDRFWAEHQLRTYRDLLTVNFVWGIRPFDERNALTYKNRELSFNIKDFRPAQEVNLTSLESRAWLTWFCNTRLNSMPGLLNRHNSQAYNHQTDKHQSIKLDDLFALCRHCAMPVWCPLGRNPISLHYYLNSLNCSRSSTKSSQCCLNNRQLNLSSPMLPDQVVVKCLHEYTNHVNGYSVGFRFINQPQSHDPKLIGLIISVVTNLSESATPHQILVRYVDQLTSWFDESLASVPPLGNLGTGFLVLPEMHNFDMIGRLLDYFYPSLFLTFLLACVLLLIVSKSLVIVLAAALSLYGCLVVTVALLTYFDAWQLGIVEVLILSLAAGLAIDPSMHLAMSVLAGLTTNATDRHGSLTTTTTLSRCLLLLPVDAGRQQKVVGSATHRLLHPLTGSLWSSGLAGLLTACLTHLRFYHQIGTFLVLLMLVSWLFCFLGFGALLGCICDLTNWIVVAGRIRQWG